MRWKHTLLIAVSILVLHTFVSAQMRIDGHPSTVSSSTRFLDDVKLIFGTGSDADIEWDQTDWIFDYDHANSGTSDFRLQEDGTDKFVVLTGGFTGFGVADPLVEVHIVGLAGSDTTLRVVGPEGRNSSLQLYADDGDDSLDLWDIISLDGGNILQIRNNASDVMTLEPAGDVGIGPANPLDLLHLFGAAPTLYIETSGSTDASIILEDTDEAGCTEITVLDGTVSGATVTCPS